MRRSLNSLRKTVRPSSPSVRPVAGDPVPLLAVQDEAVQLERRGHPARVRELLGRGARRSPRTSASASPPRIGSVPPAWLRQDEAVVAVGPRPARHQSTRKARSSSRSSGKRITGRKAQLEHPPLAREQVAADGDEELQVVRPAADGLHPTAELLRRHVRGQLAQERHLVLVQALPAERRAARQVEQHGLQVLAPLGSHQVLQVLAEQVDQPVQLVDAHAVASADSTARTVSS